MAVWTVHASYDDDARVWYVLNSDIPGLATDAPTIEKLRHRVGEVLPELLEFNSGSIVERERLQGSHHLRIVAMHESTLPVAA